MTPSAAHLSVVLSDIAAALFDLDGTLISTLQVTEQIYTRHALQHSVDPQPVIHFCHGVPTLQVLEQFFPPALHTPEYAAQLEREAADQLTGLELIPGARELLASIPLDRWAIYTSGMPFLALPRMRHLGVRVPEVMLTPVDVARGKPMPDGYVMAAERLHVDPKRCVVFEDAVAGIRAGVAAGAVVVGVRTLLDAKQLKEAGATYTVRDMTCVSVTASPADGSLTISLDES
ncbi:hypothetical protein LPJ73_000975 [Coemansia sp. RSA 2703]|nr:hypothetical protein LPJ73_000975 [Coemansia sp. RSA 2703]KAJ2376903.1 hypothetical protein IW150_001699 [Coemansia sp. RSA 2607]KAJ2397602.1 hypothetical protein GGI05_000560 [Coemansia sp. RSA 2603]